MPEQNEVLSCYVQCVHSDTDVAPLRISVTVASMTAHGTAPQLFPTSRQMYRGVSERQSQTGFQKAGGVAREKRICKTEEAAGNQITIIIH